MKDGDHHLEQVTLSVSGSWSAAVMACRDSEARIIGGASKIMGEMSRTTLSRRELSRQAKLKAGSACDDAAGFIILPKYVPLTGNQQLPPQSSRIDGMECSFSPQCHIANILVTALCAHNKHRVFLMHARVWSVHSGLVYMYVCTLHYHCYRQPGTVQPTRLPDKDTTSDTPAINGTDRRDSCPHLEVEPV